MLHVWSDADLALAATLRALPHRPDFGASAEPLLERAERHGCTGIVLDALREHGKALEPRLDAAFSKRMVARELDHAAHLGMLRSADRALRAAKLRAVALKGALLAERLYDRPSARSTTDIDILVDERDLDTAIAALGVAGWTGADDPSQSRQRSEHHHLTLWREASVPLELHFHAYRGFGRVLASEPLLARSVPAPLGFEAIRVLSRPDETVFLAVHAAGHRFMRLAWLYDLKLLLAQASDAEIDEARRLAEETGFARVVAYAGFLLEEAFGVERARGLATPRLGPGRRAILGRVSRELDEPLARSLTRFVYTTTLADSPRAAARYVKASSLDHLRRIFHRDP